MASGSWHLKRLLRQWSAVGTLLLMISSGAVAADPRDAAGSADFDALPRYPGAWISTTGTAPEAARTFALGPVERKRREVRIGDFRRLTARLETLTYELPRETDLSDLLAHYEQVLSGRVVYECRGRDCGRSNDWANTVFAEADLYGPDAQQRYLAADLGDSLLSVYLIRRGNRRVFAHLARYYTAEPVRLLAVEGDLEALLLFGHYTLRTVHPDDNGAFNEADLQALQQTGQRLAELPVPALFIVCHLHAPQRPAAPDTRRPRRPEIPDQSAAALALVEQSQTCAEQASAALQREGGPKLLPFGVGPLAPGGPRPRSHIELILPRID